MSPSVRCIHSPAIQPGATALTRTSGASTRDSVRVRLTTAALLAAYASGWGPGRSPTIEATFTTLPPAARSSGAQARVTWNSPRTLTANTRSHSARSTPSRSSGGVWLVMPALFTSASSRPNVSPTAAVSAATAASSLTSARSARWRPPRLSSSASVVWAVSRERL